MKKETPWFPGSVRPVRVGIYKRRWNIGVVYYSFWNGYFWGLSSVFPIFAVRDKKESSPNQSIAWRGLAREPKQ